MQTRAHDLDINTRLREVEQAVARLEHGWFEQETILVDMLIQMAMLVKSSLRDEMKFEVVRALSSNFVGEDNNYNNNNNYNNSCRPPCHPCDGGLIWSHEVEAEAKGARVPSCRVSARTPH